MPKGRAYVKLWHWVEDEKPGCEAAWLDGGMKGRVELSFRGSKAEKDRRERKQSGVRGWWCHRSQRRSKFITEVATKCFKFENQEEMVNSPRTHTDSRDKRGSIGEACMLREVRQKTVGYTFEVLTYETWDREDVAECEMLFLFSRWDLSTFSK